MLFNSYSFLFVFLPVCLSGCFLIARRSGSLACLWLFVASVAFYGFSQSRHLGLLVASIVCNFGLGYLISRKMREGSAAWGRRFLVFGVMLNLATLGYFKYRAFFLSQVSDLLDLGLHPKSVALPVGISFFTFTQIAYLVDCFRGLVREHNPIRYGLFVSYFPHLVAGPLLHHSQVIPRFRRAGAFLFHNRNLEIGLTVFAIGLFKKVVLADGIAPYADAVFNGSPSGVSPGFCEAWAGALAYALQLYFDFSGYSDMAIGLSRMLGIAIPANFASPYKASSIIDFWRRWHISLSQFLRDYLYIPLGGSRRGQLRRYVNLMLTMLLGGLWHGANWTFIIWGGLHGLLLMANHLFREFVKRRAPGFQIPFTLARILTFLAVVVAWVPFRSADIHGTWRMLSSMGGMNGFLASDTGGSAAPGWVAGLPWIAALLLLTQVMPNTIQIMSKYKIAIVDRTLVESGGMGPVLRWRENAFWTSVAGLLLAIGVIGISIGVKSPFLYFQF